MNEKMLCKLMLNSSQYIFLPKCQILLEKSTLYKLDAINASQNIDDLKSPPGNRLELLKGDLAEYHSIRTNSQRRIVFRWNSNAVHDELHVDYHK